jgi:hypothetical protein
VWRWRGLCVAWVQESGAALRGVSTGCLEQVNVLYIFWMAYCVALPYHWHLFDIFSSVVNHFSARILWAFVGGRRWPALRAPPHNLVYLCMINSKGLSRPEQLEHYVLTVLATQWLQHSCVARQGGATTGTAALEAFRTVLLYLWFPARGPFWINVAEDMCASTVLQLRWDIGTHRFEVGDTCVHIVTSTITVYHIQKKQVMQV